MKRIFLIALACSLPSSLFAQGSDVEFPETPAPAAVSPAPATAAVSTAPAPAALPAKPEAAAKKTAAAKKKTAPAPAPPVGPGNPAKPGDRVVMPKAEPGSQLISGELAAVAGIPREALESGGFVVGKMYTVVKGDTLWDLSGRYYKNPFLWGKIYNANFRTVADPDLINPKDELIIPDINEIIIPYRRSEAAAPASDRGEAQYAEEDPEFGEAAGRRAAPGRPAAAERKPQFGPGEILRDFDRDFLSEEMPEDQKEWSDGMKIVPDNWSEDGEITAKLDGESGSMDDSFSLSGEAVEISMNGSGLVKPGDYLAIYLKGTDAYSKSGKRLGRELQPAGLAEVVSVDGSTVKARVIDATTAISKGHIVKKK